MTALDYRGAIGTPTFDHAQYSAPLRPIDRVEVFAGGLYVFELPRMEHVQAVHAAGQGGDVLIHIGEAMPRLDRIVAPELPVRNVRCGSLVVIPEGLPTDWYAEAGQPLCHHIHIPKSLREEWAEDFGADGVRPLINRSSPTIQALFVQIIAELRQEDPFKRLKLQGLALASAAAIYRLAGGLAKAPNSQAMTPGRLRRVRAYVEDNLGQEVCLEDMAACVGLSPSHFSRAFRAETGLSPYAWVVQTRVERVKEYLLKTGKPLAEIAIDCGFSTQSHMTETFRRATGLPPARWRQEHWSHS